MGYFIYGKKQDLAMPKITGLALLVFLYLVSNTIARVIIGMALIVSALLVRA